MSFCLTYANPYSGDLVQTWQSEVYFRSFSITSFVLHADLNSVFHPKKDELDELVISSCLRSESLSDLLSFTSDSVVVRLNKSFQF